MVKNVEIKAVDTKKNKIIAIEDEEDGYHSFASQSEGHEDPDWHNQS